MPDEKIAPSQGQGDALKDAAAQATTDIGKGQAEPYFSWKYPDGKEEVYKTKEELSKAWRDSFLRQSDYTRKRQEDSQRQKSFEEERKKFQDEQKAFLESRKRYDQWDQALKTRPDMQAQLERLASSPAGPDAVFDRARGYVDENTKALQERLEALETQLEKERTDKELNETFTKMKEKYSDFDEGAVMERLEYLQDGRTEPLVDLLYWAAKGQLSPAQIEEKITENLEKKKSARMVPTGGATVKSPPKKYSSLKAAHEAAMSEELGMEIGG